MWKTAITLCGFYTRHVHLIALILSAAFAAYFAVTGDPGSISFDLFVLFYGGLAGYAVAGCLMVPVFLFQKVAGVESAPAARKFRATLPAYGAGVFVPEDRRR